MASRSICSNAKLVLPQALLHYLNRVLSAEQVKESLHGFG